MSSEPSTLSAGASLAPDTTREPSTRRERYAFFALVLLCVFFVAHIVTSATALGGQAPFDAAALAIHHLPYLPVIELLGIFLPVSLHAFWSLQRAIVSPRPTALSGGKRSVLMASSGTATLAFLVFHLLEFRIPRWVGKIGPAAFYPTLAARLSSTVHGVPLVALGYVVGITATALYLVTALSDPRGAFANRKLACFATPRFRSRRDLRHSRRFCRRGHDDLFCYRERPRAREELFFALGTGPRRERRGEVI